MDGTVNVAGHLIPVEPSLAWHKDDARGSGYVSGAVPHSKQELRILVRVPGVQDLESVAELLQLACAQITLNSREFVIVGQLT